MMELPRCDLNVKCGYITEVKRAPMERTDPEKRQSQCKKKGENKDCHHLKGFHPAAEDGSLFNRRFRFLKISPLERSKTLHKISPA